MKVDIIACYYRQARFARHFAWGLQANREHVGRVFVVSDGPFGEEEETLIENVIPGVLCRYHPKYPHGVGPSYDQGIHEAESEFVFLVSFDQILQPGFLGTMLEKAEQGKMIVGHVEAIPESTPLGFLPHPEVLRRDTIVGRSKVFREFLRPWLYGRNGCTVLAREDYFTLGGFDQRLASLGYGLEDIEFAARFVQKHGLDSIVASPASTWHFSSGAPTDAERKAKTPKLEAFRLLAETLAKLYGHKYDLFAPCLLKKDSVLVTHTEQSASGGDVRLDCIMPHWIKDALLIETTLPNPWVEKIKAHLFFLATCLKQGGSIRVRGSLSRDEIESYAPPTLSIDQDDHCWELTLDD